MKARTSLRFEGCALVLVLTACGEASRSGASVPDDRGPIDSGATRGGGSADASRRVDAAPPPIVPIDASAAPAAPDDAGHACAMAFPSVADFGKKGGFPTTKEDGSTIATLQTADCTVYRPATLGGAGDLRHPVVVWGNGTGTPTEIVYEWLLTHWASHGFIVVAANTPNAGTGTEMLRCLDWVQAQDASPGSPYAGHVATGAVATSGHSQGGGGAIMAGRDARITVTVPFMAYTQGLGYDAGAAAEQKGPMLLMSGSADTIAPPAANQLPVFQQTSVPTFWGTLAGADHVTFALGGEAGYLAPSTAWLRLFLMCDDGARAMFYGPTCTLCTDSTWTVKRKGM
jgi:predicted dienelactone hydrolase